MMTIPLPLRSPRPAAGMPGVVLAIGAGTPAVVQIDTPTNQSPRGGPAPGFRLPDR